MSSLAKQLNQIKASQPSLQLIGKQQISAPSLLFSHKVSTGIDIDTVYSIALSGFQNLIQVDPRFGKYQDVIFGSQNKRLDRMTLTEDANTQLSKQIKNFMILLSLYIINEDGQKIYDYLLRNFKIHVFEKEECIIYNLHYSSTTIFNRLIQNIELKNHKHFSFLQRFSEKDQILYRSTLVKQITYDTYILEQLIKYNEKISKLKQSTDIVIPNEATKNLTKITPQPFLLAVLTEILGIKKNNENFINLYSEAIGKFITNPKKVDQLSFALTLLISLIVKERNKISNDLIKNFVEFLFTTFKMEKVPKICQAAIFKTLIFLAQRGFVSQISQENLYFFTQYSLQNPKQTEKILKNYSSLPFVLEIVKSYFESQRNKENEKEEFQITIEEIKILFNNLFSNILGTDHCFKYSQQIRNSFCNEIFEDFFNLEQRDDNIVNLLKKFFQSELIQFTVNKLSKKEEKYIQFATKYYPSLLQLLEKKSQLFSFDFSNLQQEEDEISKKLSLKALLTGLKNNEESIIEFNEYFINTLIAQLQISKKKAILSLVLENLSYLNKYFRDIHFSQVLNQVINICETLDNQESLQELSVQILSIFNSDAYKTQKQNENQENINLLNKLHLVLIGRNIKISQENSIQNQLELTDLLQQQLQENETCTLNVHLGISSILISQIQKQNNNDNTQINQVLENITKFGKQTIKYNQIQNLAEVLIQQIKENSPLKFEFFNFLVTFAENQFLVTLKSEFLDKLPTFVQKSEFIIENILNLRELTINKERQILNLKLLLILNNLLSTENNKESAENLVNFIVQILFSTKTESNEKKVIFNIIQNILKNFVSLNENWKTLLQFLWKNRISLSVQNSDYKKVLFNQSSQQQMQQIKWKTIIDSVITNKKLENFNTEVITNLPDVFQDDFKLKFMEIVGNTSKNYFLTFFSLNNIDTHFKQAFLEALTPQNLQFSLFALSSQAFTERLDSQNQLSLLQHLINTKEIINQENYASVLNHLSDFTFTQEIINFFVEFLNNFVTNENQENVIKFKFILEVLIYQKDKENVLNITSLFNIVNILASQDKDNQKIQQNLLLVLKLVRMQKQLQQPAMKEEVLGKFANNAYANLTCIQSILQRQELKEAFDFDLSKTLVDILGQIACINFKYTSNIVYDFLSKQQSIFLNIQKPVQEQEEEQKLTEEEKIDQQKTQQQKDEIKMEQLNDLYNYCVNEILKRNPDKQEKCVKFMHSHLKIFWILLKTYQNGSDKKENRSIKRKAEINVMQIMKLYGQDHLEIILLSAITNLFKNEKNTEDILNLFLQILLQNFFKPGNPSIQFGKSLVKLQEFIIQLLFQFCDVKSIQSSTASHQKFCLIAKTFNVFHNKQGQQNIMKHIQLLFKLIFSNPIFLKMLEQVVLHKCGQEFLEELSKLYQSILRYEVKIKFCLTEVLKEKPTDKKELQQHKLFKQFLKSVLTNCKAQSQYIANILPFDYYLTICAHGLEQTSEYSIKQHILEKIGIKLDNTQIKKRQHEKIEKILQILSNDLVNNKKTFLDPKKKIARGYLQQVILFYIQVCQKKQTLLKCLDLEAFIDNLMNYFNNMDCFVFKNSMILLFAALSSLNKYKILENLSDIMKEMFIQYLAIFKYAPIKQRNLLNINEILFEQYPKIFNQPSAEALEKEISRPNIVKNKENLTASNIALFKMLINATQSFIEALQNLMTPYLLPLQHLTLYFADLEQKQYSQTVEEYMVKNVELVSARVLLEKTIAIMEISQKVSPQAVRSVAFYLASLFEKLETAEIEEFQSLIYKKYVIFFDYTRKHFINKEEYEESLASSIEKYQIEAFSNFILKNNEIQLRKMFLNLVTWSEKIFQETECGYQFTDYRKIIINKLILHLMDCLGQLFVPFYIFVFENTLKSLVEIKQFFTISEEELESNNNKKRKQDNNDTNKNLKVTLLKLQIQALKSLFEHDKDKFLDQQKIQSLADPLFDIYEANVLPNYVQFTEQNLIPCVISLFDGIGDDYKWKHINYNLILRSRCESNQVKLALLKTLTGLVDRLGDRFIVLINDLLPFLSETIDDTNNEVEALSKQLVVKLENLSGENLKEYFRSQK